MLKKTLAVTVVVAGLAWSILAHAGFITNADFETGDLTGWTLFSTPNGSNGSSGDGVDLFTTSISAGESEAARFRVGLILTGINQNPWAHFRRPIDMIFQG